MRLPAISVTTISANKVKLLEINIIGYYRLYRCRNNAGKIFL